MENRIYYKKYLMAFIMTIIIFLIGVLLLSHLEYEQNKKNLNIKLDAVIEEVKRTYPDVKDEEILNILKSNINYKGSLRKYGYELDRDQLIEKNEKSRHIFKGLLVSFAFLFSIILISIFSKYEKRQNKEIDYLIETLEKINNQNYDLELETESEDKMSILKSEIYKTTVMLKEVATREEKSKLDLKNSLSDISHQLKTPLTSVLIILDDVITDENMPESTRNSFLNNARREIMNINILIQNILKLSKLEADAIEFTKTKVNPEKIIDGAIEKTLIISDLKNVKISKTIKNKRAIECDALWQTEALTNILKNAIEHSKENGEIYITLEEKKLYTEITIKDNGIGMSKYDCKHVFDRFYKGQHTKSDSIGIGLSLAKSIIEKEGGSIALDSVENVGTTFKIRYY